MVPSSVRPWWWLLGLGVALLFGAGVRVACLGAEFWFDEILSWQLARQAGSLPGVFSIRHDNNHHLNTAWIVLGLRQGSAWFFRLGALLPGLAAIVVAGLLARPWGRAASLFAAFLVAGSYWLTLASTEARGYSLAILFALLAFAALGRYLDGRRPLALVAFWVACSLGFLSHLSFVHGYVACIVWSLRRFSRERTAPGQELRQLLVCHSGVALFFVPFYLLCIRGMFVSGAPPAPILPVLGRLLAFGLGGGNDWISLFVSLAAFTLIVVLGIASLRRQPGEIWVFYAAAVVGSPLLFLLPGPAFIFERYFLIPYVFFLLLAARVLGKAWQRGIAARCLVGVLLLAFLAGNGLHIQAYASAGRGQFREALAWLVEHEPARQITVTGNNDFRVENCLEFHAREYSERQFLYISRDDPAGADWMLTHQLDDRYAPFSEEHDEAGNLYRLEIAYPSRGPGSWGWYVYRRQR